jgi:hypothetical protein
LNNVIGSLRTGQGSDNPIDALSSNVLANACLEYLAPGDMHLVNHNNLENSHLGFGLGEDTIEVEVNECLDWDGTPKDMSRAMPNIIETNPSRFWINEMAFEDGKISPLHAIERASSDSTLIQNWNEDVISRVENALIILQGTFGACECRLVGRPAIDHPIGFGMNGLATLESTDVQNLGVYRDISPHNNIHSPGGAGNIPRSVWILAMPNDSPCFLDGNVGLRDCHWGVLVTHRTIEEIKAVLQNLGQGSEVLGEQVLGVMYECANTPENGFKEKIVQPFEISNLSTDWPKFSAQFVGLTTMTEVEIFHQGIIPICNVAEP